MQKINYETYKKPSDFIRFDQGDTTIRIVSSGAIGLFHGTKMRGRFMNLGECKGEGCPHCATNEPKMKWKWLVLDVKVDDVRLMDAGPMIGNQICEIAKLSGDPQEYSLTVTKTGEGLKTQYQVNKGEISKIELSSKNVLKKKFLINKYFTK
jgi:hypothetical protein